jgi:hypothetical protein
MEKDKREYHSKKAFLETKQTNLKNDHIAKMKKLQEKLINLMTQYEANLREVEEEKVEIRIKSHEKIQKVGKELDELIHKFYIEIGQKCTLGIPEDSQAALAENEKRKSALHAQLKDLEQ